MAQAPMAQAPMAQAPMAQTVHQAPMAQPLKVGDQLPYYSESQSAFFGPVQIQQVSPS